LRYIRFNQANLRSEKYIHLLDAITNNIDGNLNLNKIGNILSSSYTGNSRQIQEYIQDSMAYVHFYNRPDLFITFTFNPQWDKIKKYILHGQSPIDRNYMTTWAIKQKF